MKQNSKSSVNCEKFKLMVQNTILVLIVVFVFGFFICNSIVQKVESKTESHYLAIDGISEFMQNLENDSVDEAVVSEESDEVEESDGGGVLDESTDVEDNSEESVE